MSTLRVNNLGENTGPTQETLIGQARALANYNQVTPATTDSFNVSSITDDTAGHFTVNFSNAFSDANYYISTSCGNTVAAANRSVAPDVDETITASKVPMRSQQESTAANGDMDRNNVLIHGDLA